MVSKNVGFLKYQLAIGKVDLYKFSNHLNIQMVDLCPVVKRSGIQMVVWKPDWKKPGYGPKCPVFE